jgi:tricorn protease
VRSNRDYVSEKTGGKIGYLHLTDMQAAGMTEFDTWFYPQLDKQGLVIDVRWNHGGFVSKSFSSGCAARWTRGTSRAAATRRLSLPHAERPVRGAHESVRGLGR